ncbi:MAG: hypothetical protein HQK86_09860 [Nitrospinae bacterium]|nr:hypothetical protein [Nitrospinota bacterium]MBF0635243.1 hypothetical protein [Nitrospinota bacterium]
MLKKLEQITGGRNFSYYWMLIIFVVNVLFVLSIQGWELYTMPEMRTWHGIWIYVMWHWGLFYIWYFPSGTAFFLIYNKYKTIPQVFSTSFVTAFYLWIIWVVFTDENSTAAIALFFIPILGVLVAIIGYQIGVRFAKYRAT